MGLSISFKNANHTNYKDFETVKPRLYEKGHTFLRTFNQSEEWYIEKGSLYLLGTVPNDDFEDNEIEEQRYSQGTIIVFDEGIKVRIKFADDTAIKRIYL